MAFAAFKREEGDRTGVPEENEQENECVATDMISRAAARAHETHTYHSLVSTSAD